MFYLPDCLKHNLEAHICIAFTAYCIYKELERVLYLEKSSLSLLYNPPHTYNMYQISYLLPESKHTKTQLLKMDDQQEELYGKIISKYLMRKTGSMDLIRLCILNYGSSILIDISITGF